MIKYNSFNWVQLIKETKMPSGAKLVALYLSTFMNAEHDIAWPSQSRISDETGLSKPTVIKWLNYLRDQEWLRIDKKIMPISTGQQTYHHNQYIISIPKQRLNELTADISRGKTIGEQRLNESQAEVKPLNPNNNRITNNNNLYEKIDKNIKLPAWSDNPAWESLGYKFGMKPRAGEDWNTFKNRVKHFITRE